MCADRIVVAGPGIAARKEPIAFAMHEAMNHKLMLLTDNDDRGQLQLCWIAVLYQNRIAGPQNWDHARARDRQPHRSMTARNISHEIAAGSIEAGFSILRWARHGGSRYDALRLWTQEKSVVCTLPQDSAMVSNTRS
jgi:hypothetical protein